ncbi:hypothetical protein PR048_016490 [Dryococelus australis]|uniref:Uncharacterized protein n=1 Tax=Dryococelus australis TaxID=614101 RepID=A0ABQ9HL31_9NEOP|nr:hypothetical protein PR048_016490 [Dryococelus australis]
MKLFMSLNAPYICKDIFKAQSKTSFKRRTWQKLQNVQTYLLDFNPESNYRIDLYYLFINCLIYELKDKFKSEYNIVTNIKGAIPTFAERFNMKKNMETALFYAGDMPWGLTELECKLNYSDNVPRSACYNMYKETNIINPKKNKIISSLN